jgi:hypothetical protein
MATLDPSEFQELIYEELRARATSTDRTALVMLLLDGLLIGLLVVGVAFRREDGGQLALSSWWVGVIALAALLLACFFTGLILSVRRAPPIFGAAEFPSFAAYRQATRRLTDDGVLEEMARRTWALHLALRGRRIWLNASLALTLIGLLLSAMSALLPIPYSPS